MKLYDGVISDWNRLFSASEAVSLPVEKQPVWEDAGNENMVLRSDMAYELGGSSTSLAALGGTAVTDAVDLVPKDEILLIGKDLPDIREDVPYARIAVVRVREDAMGEGNALYQAIRKIEFVRYHTSPKGFMLRVSAVRSRESVRVARSALDAGLDFSKAGNVMLRAFHRNSAVEAVKLVFVTDPDFSGFAELKRTIDQTEAITKTIDHLMKNVVMDCNTCSLQEVCDEVEGLKELHFGMTNGQSVKT